MPVTSGRMREAKRATVAACALAAWVAVGAVVSSARGQQSPAEIIKAAYARLNETTHRVKRYPPDAAIRAHIADVSPPGLTRATVTMRVDQLGDIQFEEVWLRNRRAERIVAASAGGLRAQIQAASSMVSARDVLTSVLTGLLTAAHGGYYAAGPLAESFDGIVNKVTLASDLQALRSQAEVLEMTLNRWMCGGNPPGTFVSIELPTVDIAVGPVLIAGRATTKYLRKSPGTEGPSAREFVYIDLASGLPIRAEDLDDRGRVTWVTEYVDFGASISIDTPDCLTPRSPRERR